jgi:hypothetical protein
MKAYRASGSTGPLILNFGNRWIVANFATVYFTLVKERLYLLNRRLVGSQGRSETSGEENDILLLPGYETWTVQSVAQSLYRLSCPISIHVHTGYRRYIRHINKKA